MLAHVDAGKTTLSEALLYKAGELRRLGRVDHGDSFLDGNAIERNRGITVFSKQAMLTLGNTEVTLLDTPGHVDFSAEMERVLSVLDAAVLIISAADGIQSHTETLWRLLRQRRIPVFVFINKMDLAVRGSEAVIAELTASFGEGFVDFSRERASEPFLDDLTMAAPELTDAVLAGRELSDREIALPVAERRVFPCVFGSALKLEGVDRLMECIDRFAPVSPCGDGFAARVFKISRDSRGERLAFLKITGGSLSTKETLSGTDENGEPWEEKVNQIRIYSGLRYSTADRVEAGSVCAVTGLSRVLPGDVLGEEEPLQADALEPFLTYTVGLPAGVDRNSALRNIRELSEEDPKLHVTWEAETGEIGIRLMGQVQMEVLQSMIEERYGYRVEFGSGRIIYLETIEDTVEGVGHFEPLRHYAEVHLLMEPGERGSGIVYDSTISEDILPRNWQRLIMGSLEQKEHVGVLIGAPITDMRITLAAGKAHDKHTSGGDFREASWRAVRNGLMKAKSVLLEPWFEFRIELPTAFVGRAMTDIQQMGGRLGELSQSGETSVVPGEAPAAWLMDYPLVLTSYTGGQGRMSCSLKGYDVCHNSGEVKAAAGYDPERDVENTADSVFVSHSASNIVHWDEVEEHMHLPSVLKRGGGASDSGGEEREQRAEHLRRALATDEELKAIFEKTYGPVKQRLHRGAIERSGAERELSEEDRAVDEAKRRKHAHDRTPKVPASPEVIIIDGYNLINGEASLKELAARDIGAAREQLTERLINYCGYLQCEIYVVFDAYKVPYGTGAEEHRHGVTILYTRAEEPADIRIGMMVEELVGTRRVRVVSSDGLVQQNALGHDALRVSSRDFLRELRDVEEEIREALRG